MARFFDLLATLVMIFYLDQTPSVVSVTQLGALMEFKNALASNDNLISWDSNVPPCQFLHLTCDANDNVVKIDLGNSGLSGPLSSSLAQILSLQTLNLYSNNLNGTIPSELINLNNLQLLNLYGNCFSSEIPPKLLAKFGSKSFDPQRNPCTVIE